MMRVIALFVLLLAAAEAATQQDDASTQAAKKKTELVCIAGRADLGATSQTIRIECGGDIPQGSSGEANFDWSSILRTTTRLRSTRMLVDSIPETLGQGMEELISLHGTFTNDGKALPTCQTKRKVVIEFNRTSEIEFVPKKYDPKGDNPEGEKPSKSSRRQENTDPDSGPQTNDGQDTNKQTRRRRTHKTRGTFRYRKVETSSQMDAEYDEWDAPEDEDAELEAWGSKTKQCPKQEEPPEDVQPPPKKQKKEYEYEEKKEYDDEEEEDEYEYKSYGEYGYDKDEDEEEYYTQASISATPAQGKFARPTALRVKVKCKSADDLPGRDPLPGTCSVRMRLILRMTGGVNQFPFNPSTLLDDLLRRETFTCRPLTFLDLLNVLDTTELNGGNGPAVDTNLCFPRTPASPDTIPAGAAWDPTTLRRAVRFARYASTLHGCLPGQIYQPGSPPRTWNDVANWGGPTPSPQCRSCFKDGIAFGAGPAGAPFGLDSPNNPLRGSFADAAVVFTDFEVEPGTPTIVVAWRATVTRLTVTQWWSNLFSCFLRTFAPGDLTPITDSAGNVNAAAGRVCDGWASSAEPIIGGILANVKARIDALANTDGTTNTRIFVTGHSRGGALATYFAARLLAEQEAGRLGVYTGPFGRRGQVSLYTIGSPRVGDPTFARFLEERMFERFRIVNRFDPIVTAPVQFIANYRHVRPVVWYRDANALASPTGAPTEHQWCVLTPEAQLSATLNACFDSCNSATVCTNVDVPLATRIAGTRVPVSAACDGIIDNSLLGTANQVFRLPLGFDEDHGTYVGIDVNNESPECTVDQSVYLAGWFSGQRPNNPRANCAAVPPPPTAVIG